MNVLVAGTVALDNVRTPANYRENLMGGSAAYASIAASFCAPVRLVSIVGQDFPEEHIATLKGHGICTDGIEVSDGESFRWSGEYHEDMNERTTHEVAINVLESFKPKLPGGYRDSEIIVLANMSPRNQLDVLGQCDNAKYVLADTMDIWIQAERDDLMEVLGKIDLLVINESEAKLFMETTNLVDAGRRLRELGPREVVVKTGEHGALLFGEDEHDFFRCGAYPLEQVDDPTGAGDCFLGGMAGHISATGEEKPSFDTLRAACARGAVIASYNCESFSVEGLKELDDEAISGRIEALRGYVRF